MSEYDLANWDWSSDYRGDGSDTTPLDEHLLGEVLDHRPGRALDLGCGAGGNAIGLAERGWSVTGVDGADTAIASARISASAVGLDVKFELDDITTWEPDGEYELVVSSYALPGRGPDRDAALHTLRTALAPGGTLVIGDWDAAYMDWGTPDDFVTVEQVTDALDGLEIIRAESVPAPAHDHDRDDPGEHAVPGEHAIDLGATEWRAVIVIARRPSG